MVRSIVLYIFCGVLTVRSLDFPFFNNIVKQVWPSSKTQTTSTKPPFKYPNVIPPNPVMTTTLSTTRKPSSSYLNSAYDLILGSAYSAASYAATYALAPLKSYETDFKNITQTTVKSNITRPTLPSSTVSSIHGTRTQNDNSFVTTVPTVSSINFQNRKIDETTATNESLQNRIRVKNKSNSSLLSNQVIKSNSPIGIKTRRVSRFREASRIEPILVNTANFLDGISEKRFQKTLKEVVALVKQKCQHYSTLYQNSQTKKLDEVAVLKTLKTRKKGLSCNILETPLIVGGQKASENEFPHQAELGYPLNPKNPQSKLWYTCGASLISEYFVITAAHCAQRVDGRGLPSKIRFGFINKVNRSPKFLYDVESIYNHPLYSTNPDERYHDIALLKTKLPVQFSDAVRPLCLNTVEQIPNPRAIVSGFGKIAFRRARGSSHLLKATIDVVDIRLCQKLIPELNKTSQFCAGVLAGGRDTCQGDSGGPIQVMSKYSFCMYKVLGLTSYGKQCALPYSPSVYTRVSYYLPWIVSIVWPNE